MNRTDDDDGKSNRLTIVILIKFMHPAEIDEKNGMPEKLIMVSFNSD